VRAARLPILLTFPCNGGRWGPCHRGSGQEGKPKLHKQKDGAQGAVSWSVPVLLLLGGGTRVTFQ